MFSLPSWTLAHLFMNQSGLFTAFILLTVVCESLLMHKKSLSPSAVVVLRSWKCLHVWNRLPDFPVCQPLTPYSSLSVFWLLASNTEGPFCNNHDTQYSEIPRSCFVAGTCGLNHTSVFLIMSQMPPLPQRELHSGNMQVKSSIWWSAVLRGSSQSFRWQPQSLITFNSIQVNKLITLVTMEISDML